MPTEVTRRGLFAAGATLVAGAALRNSACAQESVDLHPVSDIAPVSPPVPFPALSLHTIDGAPIDWARFRGKTLVVNFWATWCVPCVAELPELDHLAETDIPVLAISADRRGAESVRPFLAAHALTHAQVALDPKQKAVEAASVRGFPTTFILDAQGRLRGKLEGPARWGAARNDIIALTK